MIIKTTKYMLKALAGIILILLMLGGLFAWKMTNGSIDIERAIPYIESQFQDSVTGESLEIGGLTLEWQGWQNPLGLSATDIIVSTERGPFLFAPEVDVNLSIRSLLLGRLKFESLRIYNIALSVTKTKDGKVQLTGRADNDDSQNAKPATNAAMVTLNNLIKDLGNIDVLWVENARLIYRDEGQNTVSHFDPVTIFIERADKNSFKGSANLSLAQEDDANTITLLFKTSQKPSTVNIQGALQDMAIDRFLEFAPALPDGWDMNMVVDADIDVTLDNTWNPIKINATVRGDEGQLNYPFNDDVDSIDILKFNAKVSQDAVGDMMMIDTISMTANEATNINLSGSMKNIGTPDMLFGDVNVSLENLPHSDLAKYWPIRYGDNGAYRWLVEKMDGGVFNTLNVDAVFDLGATERKDNSPLPPEIISVKGDMAYEGLNIDYKSPLPIAKNVTGTGSYENIALTLNVAEADIGGMITRDATLYFDDLITEGSGLATLTFPVTSSAKNVFDYIATDPINAFEKTDFKPKNTSGDVKAIIKVEIPLLKDVDVDEIKVTVEGTVDKATIPKAVKNLTLSGGPYEIFATTEQIKVKGSGQLQGKPITLDWHEYFSAENAPDYVSKVTADVTANDAIRRAFTNDFADYFRGDTTGNVVYTKDKNNRDAVINLDLDLTNTAAIEPSLGLNKKFGQKANATAIVNLRNGDLLSVKNLKITGNAVSLKSGDLDFKTQSGDPLITKANLKNLAFNDNRITILMSGNSNTLKTNITGAFLDISPILDRKKETDGDDSSGRAMDIGIDVLEMRMDADAKTLKQPKAYIKLDKNGQPDQFELDAKLGDGGQDGDLFIRYTPEVADGLSLRVESNNAGETLRAFGLYPSIRGGQLQIAGRPIQGGRFGDVKGQARINDFRVSDAPVLLRLVNALSFQNFLQAGALSFTRLESDFEWKVGDKGDIYTISNGTTSGTSVALTFDGFVDTATNIMNINGTAAPLSEINNIIGKIPLLGQLLTGGDALLAATYSISGNPSDPSVGVNPLSILTPGIIRKMLFENNPKPSESQNKNQAAEPNPTLYKTHQDRTKSLN